MNLSFAARVSLLSNVVALGAATLAWWEWLPAAPLPFVVHKALHLVGIVTFGGNLVVGPVWLAFAWMSGSPAELSFAARSLARADVWLTTPGVQLAIWNGLWAAQTFGGIRAQPWLTEAVLATVVTSVLSCTVVLWAQERLVEACERDGRVPNGVLGMWSVFGTLVSVPLGWAFWLMVSKSALLLR